MSLTPKVNPLIEEMRAGLAAPICLTWELTYGCNLSCIHCLSSSGRRDPRELTTTEALSLIDAFVEMGIFYVNIGGGEPTIRRDFKEIIRYASDRGIGVKFSTNGYFIDDELAKELVDLEYTDVQISLDGHDEVSNDQVRGVGSYSRAIAAMENLRRAGKEGFKISVVATRSNVDHLDELLELTLKYRAELRVTRLRPSGRGALVWNELRPTTEQQSKLFQWLSAHPEVLTGDSFFHLSPLGEPLPGLNMCGAGRVVCLIDPVGDVYACPFTIHDSFKAGNVRSAGGLKQVWDHSEYFESLRTGTGPTSCTSCTAYQQCQGGCMAAKFFTGLSLDDPDPECAIGNGTPLLDRVTIKPLPDLSHSRRTSVAIPVELKRRLAYPISK